MRFSSLTVAAFLSSAAGISAFSQKPTAFVASRTSTSQAVVQKAHHPVGCACPACISFYHPASCTCGSCLRRAGRSMMLFSTPATETTEAEVPPELEVPPDVEALDGIESTEEAHNAERPARKSLKKKGPRGKALSEFSVGETVTARVKTITAYGAFLDIGAQTDGLLHISQLSLDYVANVKDVLTIGQEVEVRILSIDESKSQVALSLLTVGQEQEAKDAAAARPPRQQRDRSDNRSQDRASGPRRDDSAVSSALSAKGWDPDQFVEGTVVSTVDFGAFVRVDASQLNAEVTGELDGLVHISALTAGRADSVTNHVKVDDKVQVRVKGIANGKVSLSMITSDQEQKSQSGGGGGPTDAKDWQDSVAKIQAELPTFQNRPLVVDRRK